VCSIDDDARIASELQRNELIASKKERIKRETDDMVYNCILLDCVRVACRRDVTAFHRLILLSFNIA